MIGPNNKSGLVFQVLKPNVGCLGLEQNSSIGSKGNILIGSNNGGLDKGKGVVLSQSKFLIS